LPTNLQNFTQKDITEVKIFQKVLGELLFLKHPVEEHHITLPFILPVLTDKLDNLATHSQSLSQTIFSVA